EHILFPEKKLKDRFLEEKKGAEWKWRLYTELNKVTAADLIEEAQSYFKITYLKATIASIEMICVLK
ncbi:unnamed protein product, partial [marine sediment metagenome]